MTVIDGEIVIERPVGDVFDFVADERNEPRFNSRMSRVELATPSRSERARGFSRRAG